MGFSLDFLALVFGDVAIFIIGAWAWRRNISSGAARSFFGASLVFIFWLTINYFSVQPLSPHAVDVVTRLSYAGGVWLMTTAWYFCYRFPNDRKPTLLVGSLLVSSLVLGGVLSATKGVVEFIGYRGGELTITTGPLYVTYGVLVSGLGVAAIGSLWRNYAEADLLQQNQIRYVGFGIGVSTVVSILFNVVLVPALGPSWGSSLANVLVVLPLVMFLGYAFIRHRYIEIHRLLAWIITAVLCLGLMLSWLLLGQTILPLLYPDSSHKQDIGMLVVATAAIFLSQPAARFIKWRADRLFSVGWYDSQHFLNTMGSMLAGELHLAPLLKNSLRYICSELQVTSGELLVIAESGEHKKEVFGAPHSPIGGLDATTLPKSHHIIIADELSPNNAILAQFEAHGVRIGVPLETRGRRVGYLFLGIKKHGDIFAPKDISVLEILSSQLAVAIVSAQAYEKINMFNTTLQEEIAEATLSLRQANDKLQVEDRMKTEFIMLTSHNLRTPLSIVKGYISLLEETKLDKNQTDLLTSMKAGSERLNRFTEDLLAIDSIEAGRQLVLQPTTVGEVLEPLAAEIRQDLSAKAVSFNVAIEVASSVVIDANVMRLTGAIRNLLDNALKFTKQGSVSLSAVVKDKKIIITVSDTGIGIAPAEIPRLFSRFHRATDVMHYDYEGEGIGLYLTNLVIREHNGTIDAKSKLGQGSTFIVTLPLKATA